MSNDDPSKAITNYVQYICIRYVCANDKFCAFPEMCLEKKEKKGWWVSKNWDETAVNCILSLISYLQCKKFCCQRSCANKYIKLYMEVCIYIYIYISLVMVLPRLPPQKIFSCMHIYSICRKESSKTQNYIYKYICVYWLYMGYI